MTIESGATAHLPTRFGDFDVEVFVDDKGDEHLALTVGKLKDGTLAANSLVRIHSECATGDIFGSLRCDCRDQLELSLHMIEDEGAGLFIYMRGQEGRGIGLNNKIKAYALQEKGYDTVDANLHLGFKADERHYESAVDILKHYDLSNIRLLTNNRTKVDALQAAGITVSTTVPLWAATNPYNEKYIATKLTRMGHMRR